MLGWRRHPGELPDSSTVQAWTQSDRVVSTTNGRSRPRTDRVTHVEKPDMRSQNTLVSRQVSEISMRLSCPWPCFAVPMFRFRRPGFQPDLCIASPPETRLPSTSAAPTTPRYSIAGPVPALYTGSIVGMFWGVRHGLQLDFWVWYAGVRSSLTQQGVRKSFEKGTRDDQEQKSCAGGGSACGAVLARCGEKSGRAHLWAARGCPGARSWRSW